MSDEQRCGNCKWWRKRSSTAIVSDCVFPMPALPSSVSFSVKWTEMYKSDGKGCPTFAPKDSGK